MKINHRYAIEKEIGRGGVGVVYLARDEHVNGRRVVIKVLLDAFNPSSRSLWLRHKFHEELKALARLQHPGIVTVHDAGELPDGQPFIVMEFIQGVALSEVLSGGPLPAQRVAQIVRQIGQALSAAHREKVYHRDLKPANVMLQVLADGQEIVKLIDFGIATVKDSQTNDTQTKVAGTLPYMAPEQLLGQPTALSDVYALGVVAYEMLTGALPFGTQPPAQLYQMQRDGQFPRPSALRPDLPKAAEAALIRALAFHQDERFRQAQDFGEELARALTEKSPEVDGLRVALLYRRGAQPDERVLQLLETQLQTYGCQVFVDRHLPVGVEWARAIEQRLRAADAVIPLLSAASVASEMLAYEIQVAHEAAQQQRKLRLLPVRVCYQEALPAELGRVLNPIQQAFWEGSQDDMPLVRRLLASLASPPPPPEPVKLEQPGGAVPLKSQFYVVRPTDEEFQAAIARRDSIVLVKGARQMGKTSLLARGLQQARASGARVVLTDLQTLNATHLASVEAFFLALAETIAEQLDLDFDPAQHWKAQSGPSMNFARFLRRAVLGQVSEHLLWGLDEVDRLFTCPFGSEVFGLFRSWHNARSLDPAAPWHRLTLAIAYATEAHLFITDVNQSPFNVGTRLALADFTPAQVAELNQRYGAPLRTPEELAHFVQLVGGQPYLVRHGLHELVASRLSFAEFAARVSRDEGMFGDHLRRMLMLLAQDAGLVETVRAILQNQPVTAQENFYRLRSAGVMSGETVQEARPRCQLYAHYLRKHLL